MTGQAATVALSVTIVLGVLASAAVALRLYCRIFQKIAFGADDYVIIVALILMWAVAILSDYTACVTGVGDKAYKPSLDAVILALKMNVATENSQVAGIALAKISLLLYYRGIFISRRSFVMMSNILIGVIACFTFILIMCIFFANGAFHEQWNPFAKPKLDPSTLLITFVAGSAILDLLTLSLPLLAIRNLQIKTERKLIMSIIFSLGSVAIIASILRLNYAVKYIKAPQIGNAFFEVPFIYNILMALIELPVFIIAGCLLTLGPLFRAKLGSGSRFRSLWSRAFSTISSKRTSPLNSEQSTGSKEQPHSESSAFVNSDLWRYPGEHGSHTAINKNSIGVTKSVEWELEVIDNMET